MTPNPPGRRPPVGPPGPCHDSPRPGPRCLPPPAAALPAAPLALRPARKGCQRPSGGSWIPIGGCPRPNGAPPRPSGGSPRPKEGARTPSGGYPHTLRCPSVGHPRVGAGQGRVSRYPFVPRFGASKGRCDPREGSGIPFHAPRRGIGGGGKAMMGGRRGKYGVQRSGDAISA